VKILRAVIFHTPQNAFHEAGALKAYTDGGLAIEAGKVVVCGDYSDVSRQYPQADVRDLRGGYLVPGFIDTHIHYPQTRIIGGLGLDLLDWLEQITLPEEARLADANYATALAREFVAALAAHGTTTALVFGSHFAGATECLLSEAERRRVRVFSGLVFSDLLLRSELLQKPEEAYRDAKSLISQFPRYAVMPRFALSCSEAMLEVCGTLRREHPGLLFTTHINESAREVEEVRKQFPQATDYLDVYEEFDLIGRDSVLAHNVHAAADELARLGERKASIAHCPCSNAALGSGVFRMKRHLDAGAHFGLGTDVGAGTGFGMLKESLQSYLLQRVAQDAFTMNPAQMLYLATRAGAEALNIADETGDFGAGKAADFVYIRAHEQSVLAGVLERAETPERILAAIFTLGDATAIQEVRVNDHAVHACAN
jgi:guanine deaminase